MDKEIKNEFDRLGQAIEVGFKKTEKRTDEKIDNLARMIKVGFDETARKVDVNKRFDKIEEQIAALKTEVLLIKSDIEDFKLRMGEAAFGFELQDIEKRLKKVEMKLNL